MQDPAVDASKLNETFDVVTAIEVLEHIPDGEVGRFLRTLADRKHKRGPVSCCVTKINKERLSLKEY